MDRQTVDEIKRHFEVVAAGVRGDVRLVAEGVDLLTGRVDDLTGRVGSLETRVEAFQLEVRRDFAETQAMIRLSYSELDRRLRDLETDVTALKGRLERLEALR